MSRETRDGIEKKLEYDRIRTGTSVSQMNIISMDVSRASMLQMLRPLLALERNDFSPASRSLHPGKDRADALPALFAPNRRW